jgi:transposase-like protein
MHVQKGQDKAIIRQFTQICKDLIVKILKTPEKYSEIQIYQSSVDTYNHHGKVCPKCESTGNLVPYGNYCRYLVSYTDDRVTATLIEVPRFKCKACGSSHALLPDILIPYCSYSLLFKINVLLVYFEKKQTIQELCLRFGIAVSTLYAWKKQFIEHKDLLLGLLVSHQSTEAAFLNDLFDSDDLSGTLRHFFHRFNFSFLQTKPQTTQSRPP